MNRSERPAQVGSELGRAERAWLRRALAVGERARLHASPNPWVGAVIVTVDGEVFEGWTAPPGGPHAEVRAIEAALAGGADLSRATLYVTLEPCSHRGRTGPCVDAIVRARVRRVVIGIADPDSRVAGGGVRALQAAGVQVVVSGDAVAAEIEEGLRPYLHHRRTGRPLVVVKLAVTLDGRTAAPDGSSEWITGPEARADVHRLRAESDAIVVGAGTVRADDPSLTVREFHPSQPPEREGLDPARIVLGEIPAEARVRPARGWSGSTAALVDSLGRDGALQVLVEGGPTVAGRFHRDGLVDRWVIYVAPAVLGGSDGHPVLAGAGAPTMAEMWRGQLAGVRQLGNDVRLDVDAPGTTPRAGDRDG